MSEWIEVGLHEIFKVKHGFAFSGEFFTNELQQTALVTPGNFAIGGGFKNAKPKYYNGPVPSGYALQPGQVVVTMTDLSKDGDTLGYSAVIPDNGITWLHNQRVGVLEFNKQMPVAPNFFHYLLRTENYRSWIIGSATGSTVRHTSPGRIESFRCSIPPISEQLAIAHVLGTLDDKIELNRRTNETLEAMAQALFKDWFIDFGPVHAKMEGREPYLIPDIWELFPGELYDDGKPAGWRASTLGQEIENSSGLLQTGPFGSQLHASDYTEDGTPVVMPKNLVARRVSIDAIARIPTARTIPLARHRLQPADIVFSRRGDVEKFAVISERERGWLCGTGCLLVRPGPGWRSTAFLAEMLDHEATKAWIVRHAIGATMPNLNTAILSAVPLLVPPEFLLDEFERICAPVQQEVEALNCESDSLAALRDALLPKLISGELRIKDAERFVEGAAP